MGAVEEDGLCSTGETLDGEGLKATWKDCLGGNGEEGGEEVVILV